MSDGLEPEGSGVVRVLISPVSLEEAAAIIEGGADIIDIKNVNEGSLGAQFPWSVSKIIRFVHEHGVTASATLGDLPYKPGTAVLAAYGAATCGVVTSRPVSPCPLDREQRARRRQCRGRLGVSRPNSVRGPNSFQAVRRRAGAPAPSSWLKRPARTMKQAEAGARRRGKTER